MATPSPPQPPPDIGESSSSRPRSPDGSRSTSSRSSRNSGTFEKGLASDLAKTSVSPGEAVLMKDADDPETVAAAARDSEEGENSSPMRRTKTSATDTSVATTTAAGAGARAVEEAAREWAARPWYRKLNPLRWTSIPPVPTERTPCPEHEAGVLNRLFFVWMGPLMSTGYRRPLQATDIWSVNPDRAVEPMAARVREAFKRRVEKGMKRPLLGALNEAFFWEFWIGGLCGLLSTILQVVSPFLLRYLIQFATDAYVAQMRGTPPPDIGHGIGLAVGIAVMQVVQSLAMNHFIYRGMMVGGESRAALISLIYEKSMVLSGRARAGGSAGKGDETAGGDAKKEVDGKSGKKKKPAEKTKGAGAGQKGGQLVPAGDGTGWGNGRIVNLMSVDTYRVDLACGLFHMVWTAPVSITITLVLLLVNLTYSALAGFAVVVLAFPVTASAMKALFVRRKSINKITDQRVSLTQEILQAVRFVKFFGWESAFMKRLQGLRKREISAIQILLAMRNAVLSVGLSIPIFASMLSFITYSLTNHSLNPAEIFSSLALFNGLRMPLNMLPMVLGQVTDAWSSVGRIEEFLMAEEMVEDVVVKPEGEYAAEMHNASFTWEKSAKNQEAEADKEKDKKKKPASGQGPPAAATKDNKEQRVANQGQGRPGSSSESSTLAAEDAEPFKLQDLNFQVGRNELVAVIGTVGSGKSSLLAALAGDMRKTSGEVVLGASRAFCPQYAWIQNATVRDNILFGKEMDREWYEEVVQACALQPDLEMLPNSDLTEIGERGITISGGQKQRLNIARAIYFDAGMVLMDDPLSAVDAHVGRHIFDQAILGLMKDKCRILATHQLWVLNRCDRIVWMEGGRIQAIGTYDELMGGHAGFRQLIQSHALEEKKGTEKVGKKKQKSGSKEEGDSGEDEEDDEDSTDPEDDDAKEQKKKNPAAAIKKARAHALMQTEERAVSSVPWSVYADYLRASGSLLNAPLVFALLVLAQGANIITSLWLSWWSSDKFSLSMGVYIGIYAGLGVSQVILTFVFMLSLSILGTRASKVMLQRAVSRVLRAPMSFFDTTPLGRITNRFSRDVDVMDNTLSDAMRMYFFFVSSIVAVFALIIAFFPYFAAALGPLIVAFVLAAAYYRASAREVKRFESTLRSHVFAKFGEALSGVACIRAYGLKDRFVGDLRKAIDDMDSAYYMTFSNQRWLSVRLDMIGNTLVLVCGILVTTSRFSVHPSIGGLVLSYILAIVQMLQFTIRQLAEVENGMNAAERLRYYGAELEEEAPLHTIDVAPSWPEKGEIVFEGVEMRYRLGLPLVLCGLDMRIRGGERIGIVGRTGAGKSSIMSTLFRLVELSGGRITIDGVDIATVGLGDLRSRMAIIPQDPTLFRGTVRSNLDPFDEHSDLELWSALRQADLVSPESSSASPNNTTATTAVPGEKEVTSNNEDAIEAAVTPGAVVVAATNNNSNSNPNSTPRITLDSVVEEDGLNFSLGQRQLMALARALVRGSRIIVCDEATSSVDMETDAKIQATMASGFKGKTLLCIAHRLHTIIGYDRICVMDAGRIAELDEPLALFKKEGGGIFRAMCERSGIREEDIAAARTALGLGKTE